jgi:hypothetical protein
MPTQAALTRTALAACLLLASVRTFAVDWVPLRSTRSAAAWSPAASAAAPVLVAVPTAASSTATARAPRAAPGAEARAQMCGSPSTGGPRITRVQLSGTGAQIEYGGTRHALGAYRAPERHVTPGGTLGVTGSCFGNAGSVELRRVRGAATAAEPRGAEAKGNTARSALPGAVVATAIIEKWSDNQITARLPADISGLPPTDLELVVRTTPGEHESAPVKVAFWPRWVYLDSSAIDLRARAKLLACPAPTAFDVSACRAGDSQHLPDASFVLTPHPGAVLQAEHRWHDPQGRGKLAGGQGRTDRYLIDLPAWVLPADLRLARGSNGGNRLDNFVTLAFTPQAGAQPGQPMRYAVDVGWALERHGDWAAYALTLALAVPQGMEPGRRAPSTVAPATAQRVSVPRAVATRP